jgi:group II intron reverse transcriptase/maturase
VSTDLTRLTEKARREPQLVFTSLYHHVTDVDNLRACYEALDGRKAVGVDGVTKKEYGEHLEENLRELSARLGRMGYCPQPSRRRYIPKPGSAKGRPLGISSFEDKIVESALKGVLEPLFEPLFEHTSYGYRPERSPHDCVDALSRTIQQRRVNHVVEADIRGFFDHVGHEWLMKFLEQRVGDPRVLRLVRRMLKAGILEDGLVRASDAGTPQGSILSPLLSNIYLHYVLDLWFARHVRRTSRGGSQLFRFADDFVACFQYQDDAEQFRRSLQARLEGFCLTLAEEKTRCLPFGRYARANAARRGEKPGQFDFLGFTFYCGRTRDGAFKVKRRTSRKKLRASLSRFTEWVRKARTHVRKGELIGRAKARITGHLNYYAITDNTPECGRYVYHATQILFKWINRKSQRRAYTWDGFNAVLRHVDWPRPTVRVSLCPFR